MTYTLSFWRVRWHPTLLLGLAAAALVVLLAGGVSQRSQTSPPSSPATSVIADLQRALAAAGQPMAASAATGVLVPAHAAAGLTIATDRRGSLTIGLPAAGKGRTVGRTTLFDGRARASLIAVQPTDSGVRALIRLGGTAAAERYPFAVKGAAELRHRHGGSVATRYEIQANTLVQVVDHRRPGVVYPVVADPSILTMFKCVGSIIAAAVGVGVPIAKLVQLAKYVKALGGVREAARLLIGATTKAEKLKALRKALGAKSGLAAAAALLGIPNIRDNCF